MIDIEHLNPDQLDAIQEIGEIGCSHAATAISQMIGRSVDISTPHLNIVKTSELEDILIGIFGIEEKIVGLHIELIDDFRGNILFTFPYKNALSITDILLDKQSKDDTELDEMGKSALMEIGNIVASAYVNALSSIINTPMMLSPPSFTCDLPENILRRFSITLDNTKHTLIFDIRFSGENNLFDSHFILLPSLKSLEILLDKLIPIETIRGYSE